jgi:hypothetical protein
LWGIEGTGNGSLDSLSEGAFHGGDKVLGKGFYEGSDVHVGH